MRPGKASYILLCSPPIDRQADLIKSGLSSEGAIKAGTKKYYLHAAFASLSAIEATPRAAAVLERKPLLSIEKPNAIGGIEARTSAVRLLIVVARDRGFGQVRFECSVSLANNFLLPVIGNLEGRALSIVLVGGWSGQAARSIVGTLKVSGSAHARQQHRTNCVVLILILASARLSGRNRSAVIGVRSSLRAMSHCARLAHRSDNRRFYVGISRPRFYLGTIHKLYTQARKKRTLSSEAIW